MPDIIKHETVIKIFINMPFYLNSDLATLNNDNYLQGQL